MNIRTFSPPEGYLNSAILSPSAGLLLPHSLNDPFSAKRHGFCSVRKKVSESLVVSRSSGGLVGIRCEGFRENDDAFYMRRCVEIAKKAIGCTSPNPMVGCVIVKDGKVVGEGFHPKAGQPHAEVFALRDAGDLAENATAYVSLEPCNHYGRTPPCTEALIKAKVKRVVVGMVDPNPIVASKGLERLRDSGIEVTVGVEEELCKRLNEVFTHQILTKKPFVTLRTEDCVYTSSTIRSIVLNQNAGIILHDLTFSLPDRRYSISINGQISDMLGEGAMVSGGYYSQLLQEYDGIILSSASLSGASCLPTSQEPQCRQPQQIIVASAPNIPVLTREAGNQAIIFTDQNTEVDEKIVQQGIEAVVLDELHLGPILDYCWRQGLCSVLLDMRGIDGTFEQFLEEGLENGLLQKVVMEVLPVWDGSREGATLPTKSKNLETKVHRLAKLQSRVSNGVHLVEGYF